MFPDHDGFDIKAIKKAIKYNKKHPHKTRGASTISQQTAAGSGIDVDFALWGPYNSLAAGCGGGTFPVGSPIDCSYSAAAQETASIPNAQVGQFYILLLLHR